MRITATEAKNRFGNICAQAKRGPVFIEKAGRIDSVLLSASEYQALVARQSSTPQSRKKAFEAEHKDWIALHNAQVHAHGIPGDDLRPW
jgi:prevent-host-death family protein